MYDENWDENANKVPLYKVEKSEKIVKYTKWMELDIDWNDVGMYFTLLVFLGLIGFIVWNAGAFVVWLYMIGSPWFWWISGALVAGGMYTTGRIVLYRHKKVLQQARQYGTIDE